MKTFILIAILFVGAFFALPAAANDGVFYAQGGTLQPLQETRVELRKEVLKFFVSDFKFADIDVDFQFYNPGPDRTLTVGFVSPPVVGDADEGEGSHPRITNFTVNVNGNDLKFKIARMKDTSFNAEALDINGYDYVYYFTMTFKPGMNRVRHTYRFEGGGSVETTRDFYYQITTGKRWANKEIGDFELQLHLDQGIFNLPARFVKGDETANWEIVGDGVIKKGSDKFYDFDENSIRMVHLNRGYLVFRKRHFKPDYDIAISEFNWYTGRMGKMCKVGKSCVSDAQADRIGLYFSVDPGRWANSSSLKELTASDRKILRNLGFAFRGYQFRDAGLRKYFSKFFWYKPDPGVKAEDVQLSEQERKFIGMLRAAAGSK